MRLVRVSRAVTMLRGQDLLGPQRAHEHRDPALEFQCPRQAGIPETMVRRVLGFLWSFGPLCRCFYDA